MKRIFAIHSILTAILFIGCSNKQEIQPINPVPQDSTLHASTFPLVARLAYLEDGSIKATITNVSQDNIKYRGLSCHPECYDLLTFDKHLIFKERIKSVIKMGMAPAESVLRSGENIVFEPDLSLRNDNLKQYAYFSLELSGWSSTNSYKVRSNLLQTKKEYNKPKADDQK